MINLKNKAIQFLLATVLLLTTAEAYANVDYRQVRQYKRVDNGLHRGQLNNREANRLQNGRARIEQREANFRADGNFNRGQKRKLNRMHNNHSRKMYKYKHK